MPDVPIVFDHDTPSDVSGFHVVVVSSFDVDEPVAAILEAAARVPDVPFFITGDSSGLEPRLAASRPPNVTFTGFLDEKAYGRLVSGASVVLDLTSEDHTMLRGAYEAVYQGVPVIVSDWPILREAFPFGASHVDNTAEAIAAAVPAAVEQARASVEHAVREVVAHEIREIVHESADRQVREEIERIRARR